MKRKIYITLFIALITTLAFIAHVLIEVFVINLLITDFDKYSLGLSWDQWRWVHHILLSILLIFGLYYGYRWGSYFWKLLYEGKNPLYKVPFWERRKKLTEKTK